jgi:hypothetical protein
MYGQTIVQVTSCPSNPNLELHYPHTTASDTGWNSMPDMTLHTNAIEGELILVNDGTSGINSNGNPYSQEGCSPIINDLTNKIAVIYRGSCEFGCKALNAENRGAIGVIIINNEGDFIHMLPGNCGSSVSIPVVMIEQVAGEFLASYLDTISTGATAYIGNKVNMFNNDIGMTNKDILMPNELAIPDIYSNSETINLGLWASNYGTNPQANVTASLDVYKDGVLVNNFTSTPYNFSAPTDTFIDKHFFDLGNYTSILNDVATYTLEYKINLNSDEDTTDNFFSIDYNITLNNDNNSGNTVYSKSRITADGNPITTSYQNPQEIARYYDNWETCIMLQHPSAGLGGQGYEVAGMNFSCNDDGEPIEIRAYEWNDSIDINIPNGVTFNNLNMIASNTSLTNGTITSVGFNNGVALIPNQKYLFCVYTESPSFKIGVDEYVNYNATIQEHLKPIAPVRIKPTDSPESWVWKGFKYNRGVPTISLQFSAHVDVGVGINEISKNNIYNIYPNPTNTFVNIQLATSQMANFSLIDVTGKIVVNSMINSSEEINIQKIDKGIYFYKLLIDNQQYKGKLVIN